MYLSDRRQIFIKSLDQALYISELWNADLHQETGPSLLYNFYSEI